MNDNTIQWSAQSETARPILCISLCLHLLRISFLQNHCFLGTSLLLCSILPVTVWMVFLKPEYNQIKVNFFIKPFCGNPTKHPKSSEWRLRFLGCHCSSTRPQTSSPMSSFTTSILWQSHSTPIVPRIGHVLSCLQAITKLYPVLEMTFATTISKGMYIYSTLKVLLYTNHNIYLLERKAHLLFYLHPNIYYSIWFIGEAKLMSMEGRRKEKKKEGRKIR